MMALLSRFLPSVGSGITIPLLIITLVIVGGQLLQKRDDRLVTSGKQQCNSSWLVALSKQQRDAAKRDALRAQEILEGERAIMERLQDELKQTQEKYAGYIPGDDPRCLSDGVLDALRRRQSMDRGG
ncbi:MAG: hypothetical protein K2X43_01340 [Hyphomonadaceae bacterium]|jgi:hypothetical protein|nr:hypothetical protein [Hyphomonadaceae bacterium]